MKRGKRRNRKRTRIIACEHLGTEPGGEEIVPRLRQTLHHREEGVCGLVVTDCRRREDMDEAREGEAEQA